MKNPFLVGIILKVYYDGRYFEIPELEYEKLVKAWDEQERILKKYKVNE